jgi:hypothetical protein
METTELNEATDATELTDNTEKALLIQIKNQTIIIIINFLD